MHELALIIVFIGQLWTVHLIRTGRVNYLWEKESRKRKKSNVGDEAVTAEQKNTQIRKSGESSFTGDRGV